MLQYCFSSRIGYRGMVNAVIRKGLHRLEKLSCQKYNELELLDNSVGNCLFVAVMSTKQVLPGSHCGALCELSIRVNTVS